MLRGADERVHVLVDFHNVLRDGRSPRGSIGVQLVLASIYTGAVARIRAAHPRCTEVQVYLYGGWNAANSRATALAQDLLAETGRPTIVSRVRIKPNLARGLLRCPATDLVGTYRIVPSGDSGRRSAVGQQKMVDCMLALDAAYLASTFPAEPVVIWSDDDDLVPAALTVAAIQGSCELWRRRPHGAGMNDRIASKHNVHIVQAEDVP